MAIKPIVELGNPLLRERSAEVQDFGSASDVFADLRDTLAEFRRTQGFGRGIAAVQIGVPDRLLYIETEGQIYRMANPRIAFASAEKFRLWDDCFSFPNLMVELERHREVVVEYQDELGSAQRLEAQGALAELLQHEIDHLDGVLAIDRALNPKTSFMTRREYLRQNLR